MGTHRLFSPVTWLLICTGKRDYYLANLVAYLLSDSALRTAAARSTTGCENVFVLYSCVDVCAYSLTSSCSTYAGLLFLRNQG